MPPEGEGGAPAAADQQQTQNAAHADTVVRSTLVASDEAGPPPPRGSHRRRASSLGNLLPAILLAALGLLGALVAWRVAAAGSAAGDQDRAALSAARDRASAVVSAEQQIAQTTGAWLDYERGQRRAAALDAAGFHDEALQERQVATSHWFLVRPEYVDAQQVYNPDQHRAAILQDAATGADIDPAKHEAAADAEYTRVHELLVAAFIIVLALPLATFAEFSRGRWRLASGVLGLAVLVVGASLVAVSWV
jgi:hypothetical protein